MLLQQLQQDVITAMKQRDTVRTETLRFAIAQVRKYAIDTYGASWETALQEKDVLDVLAKQAKRHQESIDVFRSAGRNDLADNETAQLAILQTYLPQQCSDEELQRVVQAILQTGETQFGSIMKKAMEELKGKADGKRVSAMVKQVLLNNQK